MLNKSLRDWLDEHALMIDQSDELSHALLEKLAENDLFRIGVSGALGGSGGSFWDAVEAVSAVARHSLTAAFVFWGHRTHIDILLQAQNHALCERTLPDLLSGRLAGATGLSNAMKFLSGLEELQVHGAGEDDGWRVDGQLFWVTNLQRRGFQVMTVVRPESGEPPFIACIASNMPGVSRSEDLPLMSMQGSATAALSFRRVVLPAENIIHPSAADFLPALRPRFIVLQCAMALGFIERTLEECQKATRAGHLFHPEWQTLRQGYLNLRSALRAGIDDECFIPDAARLFRLRIQLIELALKSVQLELMLTGGKAYLSPQGDHTARRWRECAFLPLVTPSVMQLKQQLAELTE